MEQNAQRKERKHKTNAQAISVRDRQARALQLRRGGATLDQIAKALGLAHRSSAWRLIQRALDDVLHEEVGALRTLELDRLDAMQLGVWQRAISGDDKAILSVLRIMDRRARLLGLDAPVKREMTFRDEVAEAAEKIAAEYGLDVQAIMAEADRILDGDD